jgi:pyrroloquinoline quinone biosynthesis protein B
MKFLFSFVFLLAITICNSKPYVLVLGVAQDGGFPHIGCQEECQKAFADPSLSRYVTSLALVDPETSKWWLFEATPDMDNQLQYFQELTNGDYAYLPEGIFITHAHMGHYTGLASLGREALGANGLKVYGLPKMGNFLKSNGPWSQLVELGNIEIVNMTSNKPIQIADNLAVEAFKVPHRDEFSETAGFKISSNEKSFLFIPDIDKWSKWERSVAEMVKNVDYAFLDATFFQDGELPNRAMSEVPHPFVKETMMLFQNESAATKAKIHFIHFNHTNPLLFKEEARIEVNKMGFRLAQQGCIYD